MPLKNFSLSRGVEDKFVSKGQAPDACPCSVMCWAVGAGWLETRCTWSGVKGGSGGH